MKIAICSNFSYPHTGGSEIVIHQISKRLVSRFNHEVRVYSLNAKGIVPCDGVIYCQSGSFPSLLRSLQAFQPDHTFIYSDCFVHWDEFVKHSHEVPGTKSIAMVGMNHMRGKIGSLRQFLAKQDQFSVITHSACYEDYIGCTSRNIPVRVISNGSDIDEFDKNTYDFRKEKGITAKHILLCVSNFFPGKGQEHLPLVYSQLMKKREDWLSIIICSTVDFRLANTLEKAVRSSMLKMKIPCTIYKDIPREQVVGAFKQSSLFVFPSQKEVSPIVILESQTCKLPWLSLPVGNVRDLKGGLIVPSLARNPLGFAKVTNETIGSFVEQIDRLLSDEAARILLGQEGRKQIEESYDWNKIVDEYNEVFTHARSPS